MAKLLLFKNACVVTPTQVIENGMVLVEDGKIINVSSSTIFAYGAEEVDCKGAYLIPGLIDTHSDALESEIQPRPKSVFPIEWAFCELERKLAAQGITTIHHALAMMGEYHDSKILRLNKNVHANILAIHSYKEMARLIRHYIHLRFEITNLGAAPIVEQLIEDKFIDQLSFMDHTPGQGQYRSIESQKNFFTMRSGLTSKEADEHLERLKTLPKLDSAILESLGKMAAQHEIPVASHDDDTIDKLNVMQEWKATICEFPVDLEVALEAKRRGMHVVMGAPNVLLGKSHSNNLSAVEAIAYDAVDILCSDYYPPAMMQAAFLISDRGLKSLPDAINMVTLNPARAIGMEHELGSIEVGKIADLLIVRNMNGRPFVEQVFINGEKALQMNYSLLPNELHFVH